MAENRIASFCKTVGSSPNLQKQLRAAMGSGGALERFLELANEHDYDFSLESVLSFFDREAERRATDDSKDLDDTIIQRGTTSRSKADMNPGRIGFRQVLLSGNWEVGNDESESESVLE